MLDVLEKEEAGSVTVIALGPRACLHRHSIAGDAVTCSSAGAHDKGAQQPVLTYLSSTSLPASPSLPQ
jgi:hypothetical protein